MHNAMNSFMKKTIPCTRCYIPKEASTFSRGFKESGSDNFSSISNVEYLFCYSNLVSIWKTWLRRRTNVYHTFIFANEFILYHKLLLLSWVFCAVRSSNLAQYFDNIYILISYLIFKHAFLNPIFSIHILFSGINVALHLLIVDFFLPGLYTFILVSALYTFFENGKKHIWKYVHMRIRT